VGRACSVFRAVETEPAAIMLDKMPRPEDVVAKGSIFWDVLKKT
jgi:hypothetical protein